MQSSRVLLALPESEATGLAEGLDGEACNVTCVSPDQLLKALEEEAWTVVLTDPGLLGTQSGTQLEPEQVLEAARQSPGQPAVLFLAGFGSVAQAVQSIQLGAFDYLSRPTSEAQVEVAVRRALDRKGLEVENAQLKQSLEERRSIGHLQSRDPVMRQVIESAQCIADTRANVLISGESGTGKTMLARGLHLASSRSSGPFIEVNCGALPDSLLESELFGHAKGSFTGANSDKIGKFEAAEGGTLFLDEIGTASPELQIKLLRVLQDREFERLGETQTRKVDLRLITATNEDLEACIEAGSFRQDLYYRINVVSLKLPPLRERPSDLASLAHHFLERFSGEHERPVEGLSSTALASLAAHSWPGNVRELENRMERAILMARGSQLQVSDLGLDVLAAAEFGPAPDERPLPVQATRSQKAELLGTASEPVLAPNSNTALQSQDPAGPEAFVDYDPRSQVPMTLKEALEGPERAIIQKALTLNGGNRKQTARQLGVNRTTLFNKMRKYGLLD